MLELDFPCFANVVRKKILILLSLGRLLLIIYGHLTDLLRRVRTLWRMSFEGRFSYERSFLIMLFLHVSLEL